MNDKAIQRQDTQQQTTLDLVKSVYRLDDASPEQIAFFGERCKTLGLSVPARQVYPMLRRHYKTKEVEAIDMIVSIDGLRMIAARSGEYAGQTEPQWCGTDGKWMNVWFHNYPPAAARVGVRRVGIPEPTYAIAHYAEHRQTNYKGEPTQTWAKMPALMLAKCAEAQALRKAFPGDMSGVYAHEEVQEVEYADQPHTEPAEAAGPTATDRLKGKLGLKAPQPDEGSDRGDDPKPSVADTDADQVAALVRRWGQVTMEIDGSTREQAWKSMVDHCKRHNYAGPDAVPVAVLEDWVASGEQAVAEAREADATAHDEPDDETQHAASEAATDEGLYEQ